MWHVKYYTRSQAFRAGTLHIEQYGIHDHAGERDSHYIWPRSLANTSTKFLQALPKSQWSIQNLKQHLASEHAGVTLPTDVQISKWLENFAKRRGSSSEKYEMQPGSETLLQVVKMRIDQRRRDFQGACDDLVVLPFGTAAGQASGATGR
eukprot:3802286-Karenia_brevis.AAC.1